MLTVAAKRARLVHETVAMLRRFVHRGAAGAQTMIGTVPPSALHAAPVT